MNMIMTPNRVLEARELLVDQLTQRVCDSINNHLISGYDSHPLWTLKLSKESIFTEAYHVSLWDTSIRQGVTVGDEVLSRIAEACHASGYNTKLNFDAATGSLNGSVSICDIDLDSLNILDFAQMVLGCHLHPVQKIFLKALYAGAQYNEGLNLDSSDEMHLRHQPIAGLYGLSDTTAQGLRNLASNRGLDHTRVRIGRRGGMTFLSSICAAYELYRNNTSDQIIAYVHMSDKRVLMNLLEKMIECFPGRKLKIEFAPKALLVKQGEDVAFVAQSIMMFFEDKQAHVMGRHVKTLITENYGREMPLQAPPDYWIAFLDASPSEVCGLDFPAWIMNPNMKAEDLIERRKEDPERFDKQFGAR